MSDISWSQAISNTPIFKFISSLTDWAEKSPTDFISHCCLYLTPFAILAVILTFKLSKMIETKQMEEQKLAQMKKKQK